MRKCISSSQSVITIPWCMLTSKIFLWNFYLYDIYGKTRFICELLFWQPWNFHFVVNVIVITVIWNHQYCHRAPCFTVDVVWVEFSIKIFIGYIHCQHKTMMLSQLIIFRKSLTVKLWTTLRCLLQFIKNMMLFCRSIRWKSRQRTITTILRLIVSNDR